MSLQPGQSHPSRGAWIEIGFGEMLRERRIGRTPHGVRGLKFEWRGTQVVPLCRTPHGVRGLKYPRDELPGHANRSHPSRGAWIEMLDGELTDEMEESHPSRGAWIEINNSTSIST